MSNVQVRQNIETCDESLLWKTIQLHNKNRTFDIYKHEMEEEMPIWTILDQNQRGSILRMYDTFLGK